MKEAKVYIAYYWPFLFDRIDSLRYFAGEQARLGNTSSPEAWLVQRQVVARACMHLVLQNTP